MTNYPSIASLRSLLRNNITKPFRERILKAFIIGSEAKGTATSKSDLDVAVVIRKRKTKSSLKFTEQYHSNFTNNAQKSKWNNRIIDFQFFYEDDEELNCLPKLEI